jgi:hypothetical protein
MNDLKKLLLHASSSIAGGLPILSERSRSLAGNLTGQLLDLLKHRNGFYAFESALHVFPSQSLKGEIGICDWNDDALWRDGYKGLIDGCIFFAEDVFGGQFCLRNDKVYTFDPETASLEYLADDIEHWVDVLLNDYEVLTGYPLAHQWQIKNGPLQPGQRLFPKLPFVMGGEFTEGNLYSLDAVAGMRFRAEIASQINALPDGAEVKISIER